MRQTSKGNQHGWQEQLTLEPYHRDHALVVGIYRASKKKKEEWERRQEWPTLTHLPRIKSFIVLLFCLCKPTIMYKDACFFQFCISRWAGVKLSSGVRLAVISPHTSQSHCFDAVDWRIVIDRRLKRSLAGAGFVPTTEQWDIREVTTVICGSYESCETIETLEKCILHCTEHEVAEVSGDSSNATSTSLDATSHGTNRIRIYASHSHARPANEHAGAWACMWCGIVKNAASPSCAFNNCFKTSFGCLNCAASSSLAALRF